MSELTINHGTTATRLRADKYEVVIDGPSDGLTIENDQFTLKKGETVVARIRLDQSLESSPAENAPTTSKSTPVYEGQTLDQWLNVVRTDRSPQEILKALTACSALLSETNSSQITECLLEILPKVDGEQTIDSRAFPLLVKANPGAKWSQMMAGQLRAVDEAWRTRLLAQLLAQLSHVKELQSIDEVTPIVEWAQLTLSPLATSAARPPLSAELAVDAAKVLLVVMHRFPEEKTFNEAAVAALRDCFALDSKWWLAKPLPPLNERYRHAGVDYWPPALADAVTLNAIKVLVDQVSSSSDVAEAAMILSDAPKLTEDQKTEITDAVNRRLVAASESAEKLVEVADVSNMFLQRSVPEFVTDKKVTWFLDGKDPGNAIVVVELLDLLEKTGTEASSQSGVLALQSQLNDIGARKPPFLGQDMNIFWPASARITTPINIGGGSLPPSDFARLVIAYHPVMKGEEAPEPQIRRN